MTGDRLSWVEAAPLVLLGILARLLWLGAAEPGTDEALSALAVALPLGELMEFLGRDVHPPGFFLLLQAVSRAGGGLDPALLRLVSALASVGGLALGAALFRRNLGRVGAAVALAFLALSPFQLALARSGRMYGLALLLGVALAHATEAYLRRPSPRALALLAGVEVALVHTHYLGWLPVLALALLGLRPGATARRRWLLAHLGVVLVAAPWLAFALGAKLRGGYLGDEWRLAMGWLRTFPDVLGVARTWLDGVHHFTGAPALWWAPWVALGLGAAARGREAPAPSSSLLGPAAWLLGSALLLTALLQPLVRELHGLERYLVPLSPWFLLLLGAAADRLAGAAGSVAGFGLVAGALAWAGSAGLGFTLAQETHPVTQLAAVLHAQERPPLLVSFGSSWPLAWHFRREPSPEAPASWVLLSPRTVHYPEEGPWDPRAPGARDPLGGPLVAKPDAVLAAAAARPERALWVLVDPHAAAHDASVAPLLQSLTRARGAPQVAERGSRGRLYLFAGR